jgi:hypothetical protein
MEENAKAFWIIKFRKISVHFKKKSFTVSPVEKNTNHTKNTIIYNQRLITVGYDKH